MASGAITYAHRFSGMAGYCQVGFGKAAEAGGFRMENGSVESRGRKLPVLENYLRRKGHPEATDAESRRTPRTHETLALCLLLAGMGRTDPARAQHPQSGGGKASLPRPLDGLGCLDRARRKAETLSSSCWALQTPDQEKLSAENYQSVGTMAPREAVHWLCFSGLGRCGAHGPRAPSGAGSARLEDGIFKSRGWGLPILAVSGY